jgi:PQQ-dependent catabolism-associated CXXCW motif protein
MSIPAAEKACKVGPATAADVSAEFLQRSGNVPTSVPGGITVSAKEAKCLMDGVGSRLVVIQAMRDDQQLPGAHALPSIGSPRPDDKAQEILAKGLDEVTGGDKKAPLLIYCHGDFCHLSYNATLRAVKAGYSKIYWLRDGNKGWMAAGLPLKGEELDARGFPARYAGALEGCDKEVLHYDAQRHVREVLTYASAAELEESVQDDVETATKSRAACLQKLQQDFAASQAVQADLSRHLQRNEQHVARHFKELRAAVEGNPAGIIKAALDAIDLAGAKRVLADARDLKNKEGPVQRCGSLGSTRPRDNDEIHAARRLYEEHDRCLASYGRQGLAAAFLGGFEDDEYRSIQGVVAATARFTCSRRGGANCLPDASWRRLADVASEANTRLIDDAIAREEALNEEVDAAEQRLNQWAEQVKAYIAARNREIEESNARQQSRSQQIYTAPAPSAPSTYRRPPSNYSLPGMR